MRQRPLIQVDDVHFLFDNVDEAECVGSFLPVRRFAETAVELKIWLYP